MSTQTNKVVAHLDNGKAFKQSERYFRALIEHSSDAIALVDDQGKVLYASPSTYRLLGYTPEELVGRIAFELIHPDDQERTMVLLAAVVQQPETSLQVECRLQHKDGTFRWMEAIVTNLLHDPSVAAIVGNYRDITERKRFAQLMEGQRRVVEMVAQGAALQDALEVLVRLIEQLSSDGLLASILLLDEDGIHLRHGVAPSLPESYTRAIDGITIGPEVGSCGTAAYRKKSVIVSDITTDPLWAEFKDLAQQHHLRACWSTPICSSSNQVLGTFAMYYREPRSPSQQDWQLIDLVTRTVALAIERKRAEQEREILLAREQAARQTLQRSQERLTLAQQAAHIGTFEWIIPTGEVTWTVEEEALYGLPPGGFGGRFEGWEAFLHPEDHAQVVAEVHQAVAAEQELNTEFRIVWPDGSIHWIEAQAKVFTDEQGTPQRIIGVNRDITEHKAAQEAMRASEARFWRLFESNIIGVFVSDFDGRFLEANDILLQMLGYTREELEEGLVHRDTLTPPEYAPVSQQAVKALREVGFTQPYEKEYLHKNGTRIPILVAVTRLDPQQDICSGFVLDISERKAFERRKDAFLSMVSHELKTPVTSLKGFTYILQRRLKSHADKQTLLFLERMDLQFKKLTTLINDLLDLSRIQTSQLVYRDEQIDLDELVQDIVDQVQATSDSHQLRLLAASHVRVRGDRERLGQVLTNLLSNAAKYSPHANIVNVRVERERDQALVSVQDFGIGIAQAHQQHIFERFYRVTDPLEQTFPGLGIGLYLCHEIVKRHQGRIWVESHKEEGSTFRFSLPLSSSEENESTESSVH